MKLLIPLFLLAGLAGSVLFTRAAGQAVPTVTADTWYCTQSSYDDKVCFQFGKIVVIVPSQGFVSLVSGEAANLDTADFNRLIAEAHGLIPAALAQASGVAKR